MRQRLRSQLISQRISYREHWRSYDEMRINEGLMRFNRYNVRNDTPTATKVRRLHGVRVEGGLVIAAC